MRKIVLTLWFISYIAFAAVILVVTDARGGDLPKYVDVEFTSIADLDARTDSVLEVCEWKWHFRWTHEDSAAICYEAYTCRHFVSREIWWMPDDRVAGGILLIGQARIWYEEVQR